MSKKEKKYVFVPVSLFTTLIEGAEPYGKKLRLPLSENEFLKGYSISTDYNATILPYKDYGNEVPSICLVIKSVTDSKTLRVSTKVSVVAQKVASIGYFPIIYGAKRFFDQDCCGDETRERLIGEMKDGIFGDFFYCYLEMGDEPSLSIGKRMASELLRIEGYDYLIPKKDAPGGDMLKWDRINKSCSIWSRGHLDGYQDSSRHGAHYGDEL